MKQEKEKIEFRYYELPKDLPILALLGEEWELPYGTDLVHFHNHLEIGYCYYGEGVMCYGEMRTAYDKGTLTVISEKLSAPHGWRSKGYLEMGISVYRRRGAVAQCLSAEADVGE